jgi:hypothetical protein
MVSCLFSGASAAEVISPGEQQAVCASDAGFSAGRGQQLLLVQLQPEPAADAFVSSDGMEP